MVNWTNYAEIGGGAGIIATILTWLRMKAKYESKVDNMCADLEGLKKRVRFTDTCRVMYEGIQHRLTSIEAMQKETRDDIKELLKHNGIHKENKA